MELVTVFRSKWLLHFAGDVHSKALRMAGVNQAKLECAGRMAGRPHLRQSTALARAIGDAHC